MIRARTSDTEQRIRADMERAGLLATSEIAVRVRGGVAYIEGSASSLDDKRLAEAVAMQAEGVYAVVNRLAVAPMAVVRDDELAERVREALGRSSTVDADSVSVQVVDGCVCLCGTVGTHAERCVAEREVWAVRGVRKAKNEICVASGKIRRGIDVVDEVLQGLRECLGINTSEMDVAYRRGTIWLKGRVRSSYLKRAAEDLACWTTSVVRVVNRLQVAPGAGDPVNMSFPGSTPTPDTPQVVRGPADVSRNADENGTLNEDPTGGDLVSNPPR